MGARISHMNLYALSTLVQADDYDVENILFLFEGKPKKFRHVAHETTGKVYEDVPMRANPTDEELLEKYYVEGDLKETWDRQEALKAAKLAAIEAAEQERKDREREAMQEARRRQQASSKKREAKAQVKQETPVEEEEKNQWVKEYDEESQAGKNEIADKKEAEKQAEEAFKAKEEGEGEGGEGDSEDEDSVSLSLGGASASMAGSATSIVSGGGSMADMGSKGGGDNTSITSDMVDVDNKVRSFYNETELAPEPGWDLPESYIIPLARVQELAKQAHFEECDVDLLTNLFRLVDARGWEECDIRFVLVPFCMCVAVKSGKVAHCFDMVFRVYDRASILVMEKPDILKVFNLMNEAIVYLGDRPLDANYITDLVDSLYTSAGKIDGTINWNEYVELVAEHPIVEMLLAPQYQGLARDKVFDEETLQSVDVQVGVDYSKIKEH